MLGPRAAGITGNLGATPEGIPRLRAFFAHFSLDKPDNIG